MIVEKVDPARDSFSNFSLEEKILTIGGVAIDLEAEEGDQEKIITLGSCNGMVHRGLMPCCIYVADVIIPPRKYEPVEVEGPASSNAGGGNSDEEQETHIEMVPVPLNTDIVTLRLWPLEDVPQVEGNHMAIEEENHVAE
ncbi:hypothetical protein AGMMS49944_09730 [Spirochaetia bacterium]|nr:hypothetical protein AGMMS49944_09730 [Spirochaetia bacterium]